MIETKKEVNYKIDWRGNAEFGAPVDIAKTAPDKIYADRKAYFSMLRSFLTELDKVTNDYGLLMPEDLEKLLAKYNIHFVDVDDIPRVNIDEPKGE